METEVLDETVLQLEKNDRDQKRDEGKKRELKDEESCMVGTQKYFIRN